jgi:hypothetical protein
LPDLKTPKNVKKKVFTRWTSAPIALDLYLDGLVCQIILEKNDQRVVACSLATRQSPECHVAKGPNCSKAQGLGKLTAPLSAFRNVLSAFHFPLSAPM